MYLRQYRAATCLSQSPTNKISTHPTMNIEILKILPLLIKKDPLIILTTYIVKSFLSSNLFSSANCKILESTYV